MWSGALVSCGRGFLSLTLELEAQPILILSRPCLFKALLLIHMHTATFHFSLPAKWWDPATARCVSVWDSCWPSYLTEGENTVKSWEMREEPSKDRRREKEAGKNWIRGWEETGNKWEGLRRGKMCGAVIMNTTLVILFSVSLSVSHAAQNESNILSL